MKIVKLIAILIAFGGIMISSIVIYNHFKRKEGLVKNYDIAGQLTMKFQNDRSLMQNMAEYLVRIDTCSEFFIIEYSNGEFYFKNDFVKMNERLPFNHFFEICNSESTESTCCNSNGNKNFSSPIKNYMKDHRLSRIIIRNTAENVTIRQIFIYREFYPVDREITMNYSLKEFSEHKATDIEPNEGYFWKVSLSPNWWLESEILTNR